MGETLLFYFVFLSQILLISAVIPRRVVNLMRQVRQKYPPSTHPKLYPKPAEYYESVARNFTRLNLAIVVAGLLIIAALILGMLTGEWDGAIVTPWSASGEWDAAIVIPFTLVQLIPTLYLEIQKAKHYKAMAKFPLPPVRTAELRRRRLFDFVSPAMLVVAVLVYVAFVAFVLYYRRFEFPWFTAAGNIAGITAMNVLMAASVGWALHAGRRDHYQAHQDRLDLMRMVAKWSLILAIVTPLSIATQLVLKVLAPEMAETLEPVIASVYSQVTLLAVLWPSYSYRIDKVNFDVYKQDAQPT